MDNTGHTKIIICSEKATGSLKAILSVAAQGGVEDADGAIGRCLDRAIDEIDEAVDLLAKELANRPGAKR